MDSVAAHLRAHGWATIDVDSTLAQRYERLVGHANWLFDQPSEAKALVDIRLSIGHRGWVPPDEVGDYADEGPRRYEAFDIGRTPDVGDTEPQHPLHGLNVWPEGVHGEAMQVDAEATFSALSAVAVALGDAICDNLNVPREELRQLRSEPVSQLRLIRYFDAPPQASERDGGAAMGAHTDYEFFTFLFQTTPGAQILDPDGAWADALHQGVITVIAGDMLEVFSNGAYISAMHRAAAHVDPGRVSIPFFAGADYDATVNPVVAGSRSDGIHFGEHLMSQLQRDFPYLRNGEDTVQEQAESQRSVFEERAALRLHHRDTQSL